MSQLFQELKRRNVFRVGLAYLAVAWLVLQAGEREIVNQMAAELDAAPYGYLRLMTYPGNCFCGAPWDLEVTPNFARLLEAAELPWPPKSPINWPLKDW